MKVLVIDDDTMFCEPLVWRLVQEGYEVTYCKLVEEVLDEERKLKVPVPDLILLDIMMPRGEMYSKRETDRGGDTGLILLGDIQKVNPNIPVIIITVRKDITLAGLQEKYGASVKELIVKPVRPGEVIEQLNKIFPKQSK